VVNVEVLKPAADCLWQQFTLHLALQFGKEKTPEPQVKEMDQYVLVHSTVQATKHLKRRRLGGDCTGTQFAGRIL
jgi:hypothetical protein